jgi:hypothetical protein
MQSTRSSLQVIGVILLLVVLIAGWWIFTNPRPRETTNSTATTTAQTAAQYENATYGYAFSYPRDYDVREYTPEYVSVGHATADGFDPYVEVGVAQSQGEGMFTSFSQYVKSKAEALCAADGPTGSLRCSVARSDAYPSPTGLSGSVLYLTLTTKTTATTTSEQMGPLYVFNISANTASSTYGALIISPSLTHATDTDANALAKSLADTLSINKVETRP